MNGFPQQFETQLKTGVDGILEKISKSPIMIGLAVLMINLSGRYLATDITLYDEKVLNNKFMKKITIFSIAFLSTRDIRYAVIIVLLYSLLFNPCGLAYKIMKKTQRVLKNPININSQIDFQSVDLNLTKVKNNKHIVIDKIILS